MGPRNVVVSDRGGIVENTHIPHVAVVDSTGSLLFSLGNPTRMTLLRSAVKPYQALSILETGCFERYGLDNADLALICASHSSEQLHLDQTRKMLGKIGAKESDIQCGGHPALMEPINRQWAKDDYKPGGADNNCSGKHVGMIAGALALGGDVETYHQAESQMQRHTIRTIENAIGSKGVWGLDGCNLPAPGYPLNDFAKIYATVSTASPQSNDKRERTLARVYSAMTTYPELVGGTDRFCTVLMQLGQGRLVGKLGADACYGVGIRACRATEKLGAVGGVGIAVKIEDGNEVALYVTVVEVLRQLALLSDVEVEVLSGFHQPVRLNTMGVPVGLIRPDFNLVRAG
jgi:L-asparaginase II